MTSDQKGAEHMPAISMFYGILIYMYYFDNKKHHLPHIHAKFGENEAILSIANGETLEGELPSKKNEACAGMARDTQ